MILIYLVMDWGFLIKRLKLISSEIFVSFFFSFKTLSIKNRWRANFLLLLIRKSLKKFWRSHFCSIFSQKRIWIRFTGNFHSTFSRKSMKNCCRANFSLIFSHIGFRINFPSIFSQKRTWNRFRVNFQSKIYINLLYSQFFFNIQSKSFQNQFSSRQNRLWLNFTSIFSQKHIGNRFSVNFQLKKY